MEKNKLCISVAEMAESLGISLTAAYRLAKSHDFYPAKKVCGRLIISITELDEWLKKQNQKKIE